MLGRYFPISVGICADAANAAKQIYNEIKEVESGKEVDLSKKIDSLRIVLKDIIH